MMGQILSSMGWHAATIDHNSGGGTKAPTERLLPRPRLDHDTLSIVSPYFDNPSLAAFSNTCSLFHAASRFELERRMPQYLLEYVVRGEQAKAEALLVTNPRLLLLDTGITINYSGIKIQGLTAWQAALCTADVEMLTMMQHHFTRKNKQGIPFIKNGEHKKHQQTLAIFPEGYEAHIDLQRTLTFDFNVIANAINEANSYELQSAINLNGALLPATNTSPERKNAGGACTVTVALNEFRIAFTSHSLKEMIYNPQHLLRALQVYTARFHHWSDDQCQVFWTQVVGFVQHFMPACYAQAFAQGLPYLLDSQPATLKRSFDFGDNDKKIVSDVGSVFCFQGLGFTFAASLRCGAGCSIGPDAEGLAPSRSFLQDYISKKISFLCGLMPQPQQHRPAP